jgi:hypothetical protein
MGDLDDIRKAVQKNWLAAVAPGEKVGRYRESVKKRLLKVCE